MAGEDVVTLRVRGEGGAEWDVDVPTTIHARERFEQQITKGQLTVLVEDGEALAPAAALELINGPAEGTVTEDNPDVGPASTETVEGLPPKHGPGSGLKEWAAFAATLDIDTAGMNRAEMIAAVEAVIPPAPES